MEVTLGIDRRAPFRHSTSALQHCSTRSQSQATSALAAGRSRLFHGCATNYYERKWARPSSRPGDKATKSSCRTRSAAGCPCNRTATSPVHAETPWPTSGAVAIARAHTHRGGGTVAARTEVDYREILGIHTRRPVAGRERVRYQRVPLVGARAGRCERLRRPRWYSVNHFLSTRSCIGSATGPRPARLVLLTGGKWVRTVAA